MTGLFIDSPGEALFFTNLMMNANKSKSLSVCTPNNEKVSAKAYWKAHKAEQRVAEFPVPWLTIDGMTEWSDLIGPANKDSVFYRLSDNNEIDFVNWKGTSLRYISPENQPKLREVTWTEEQKAKRNYPDLKKEMDKYSIPMWVKGVTAGKSYSDHVLKLIVKGETVYVNSKGTPLWQIGFDQWPPIVFSTGAIPKRISKAKRERRKWKKLGDNASSSESDSSSDPLVEPQGGSSSPSFSSRLTAASETLNRAQTLMGDFEKMKENFSKWLNVEIVHSLFVVLKNFEMNRQKRELVAPHNLDKWDALWWKELAIDIILRLVKYCGMVMNGLVNDPLKLLMQTGKESIDSITATARSLLAKFRDSPKIEPQGAFLVTDVFAFMGRVMGIVKPDDKETTHLLRNLQVLTQMRSLWSSVTACFTWVMSLFFEKAVDDTSLNFELDFVLSKLENPEKNSNISMIGKALVLKTLAKHSRTLETEAYKDRMLALKPLVTEWVEEVMKGQYEDKLKINPLVVVVQGKAGVGKSGMLEPFYHKVYEYLDEKFDARRDYFCKAPSSEYWDGYEPGQHKVVGIDDFGVCLDPELLKLSLDDFMKISSIATAPLNMADLGGKGTSFFTSESIYVTTNQDFSNGVDGFRNQFADPVAFLRRMDIVAEVVERTPVKLASGVVAYDYKINWRSEPVKWKDGMKVKSNTLSTGADGIGFTKTGNLDDFARDAALLLLKHRMEREEREKFNDKPVNVSMRGVVTKQVMKCVKDPKCPATDRARIFDALSKERELPASAYLDKNLPNARREWSEAIRSPRSVVAEIPAKLPEIDPSDANRVEMSNCKTAAETRKTYSSVAKSLAQNLFDFGNKTESQGSFALPSSPEENDEFEFCKNDDVEAQCKSCAMLSSHFWWVKMLPKSMCSKIMGLYRSHHKMLAATSGVINGLLSLVLMFAVGTLFSKLWGFFNKEDTKEWYDHESQSAKFELFPGYEMEEYAGEVFEEGNCPPGVHSHICAENHWYTHSNPSGECPICGPSRYLDVDYEIQSVTEGTKRPGKVVTQSVTEGTPRKGKIVAQSVSEPTQRKMKVSVQSNVRPHRVISQSKEQSNYRVETLEHALSSVPEVSAVTPFMKHFTYDPNTIACHRSTIGNACSIAVDSGVSLQGFVVKDRLVVVPAHLFPRDSVWNPETRKSDVTPTQRTFTVCFNGKNIKNEIFPINSEDIYFVPENDVAFFHLPKHIPAFKDLSHHFVDSENLQTSWKDAYMSTPTFTKDENWILLRKVANLKPMNKSETWDAVKGTKKVIVSRGFSGAAETSKGDCGSLIYVCDPQTPRKILGLHVAFARDERRIRACVVSQSDIEKASAFLNKTEPQGLETTIFLKNSFKVNELPLLVARSTGKIRHYGILQTFGYSSEAGAAHCKIVHLDRDAGDWTMKAISTDVFNNDLKSWYVVETNDRWKRNQGPIAARIMEWVNDEGESTGKTYKWRPWSPCDVWARTILDGEAPLISQEFKLCVKMGINKLTGFTVCQADTDDNYDTADDGIETSKEEEDPVPEEVSKLESQRPHPLEKYETVIGEQVPTPTLLCPVKELHEAEDIPFQHFEYTGPAPTRHVGADTAIRKSALFGKFPNAKAPAILRPKFVDGKRVDPMKKDLDNADVPRKGLPRKHVELAMNNFLECFERESIRNMDLLEEYPRHIWTEQEGLNGLKTRDGTNSEWALPLNLASAPGYPWKGGSKSSVMARDDGGIIRFTPEGKKAYQDALASLEAGARPFFKMVPCLKDELREHAKVEAMKTRVFIICNCILNVLVRQYFGDFIAHLMALHNTFEVSVGINVHGEEATLLANRLKLGRGKLYLAGDWKAWDKRLTFAMGRFLIEAANRWYGDDNDKIRDLLGEEIFNGDYLIQGKEYNIPGMMPSGVAFTAVGNSVINLIVLRLAICDIVEGYGADPNSAMEAFLTEKANMCAYGDDHIIQTDVLSMPGFNMKTLSDWAEKYGLNYTHPNKIDALPEFFQDFELEYLKRTFVMLSNGSWKMPLKLSTIYDIANFHKKTIPLEEYMEANYRAMAIELLHYDENTFKSVLDNYRRCAADIGIWVPTLDFWRFKTQIEKTATTLGFESVHAKTIAILQHYMNIESHHILGMFHPPSGPPSIKWCPTYMVGSCRGGAKWEHHVCSHCGKVALHLDEAKPRRCLRCIGFAGIPDWYYHNSLDCRQCLNQGSALWTILVAANAKDKDFQFEVIRLISMGKEILPPPRDLSAMVSINPLTDAQFVKKIREPQKLASPSSEDWPAWASGHQNALTLEKWTRPLFVSQNTPQFIMTLDEEDWIANLLYQLYKANSLDVVVAAKYDKHFSYGSPLGEALATVSACDYKYTGTRNLTDFTKVNESVQNCRMFLGNEYLGTRSCIFVHLTK